MTYIMFFFLPTDADGVDLNPVQDTPVSTHKEDTYIHFNLDVEIQKHLEKLPKGPNLSALFVLKKIIQITFSFSFSL